MSVGDFIGPMAPGMRIDIKLDNEQVTRGLGRLDPTVEASVDRELDAIAQGAALDMKAALTRNRSLARSTLVLSVMSRRIGRLHYWAGPGTNYARIVEEGSGPAVGKPNYMPNPQYLEDYVKQRNNIKLAGKAGSARRRKVLDNIRDRAWGLAVHIWHHGTKPHPFVAPVAEKLRASAPPRVLAAVERGLQEAFRA